MLDDRAPAGKELKYARRERERRFLFGSMPDGHVVRIARIFDRYLVGTRVRLRLQLEVSPDGELDQAVYKLTQKLPAADGEPGLTTTMYLDAAEYAVLALLLAASLRKTRLSIPPFGVDVFEDALAGLVLGEAEFTDDESMRDFVAPAGAVAEVTSDERLTGGRLVAMTESELTAVLADYGIDS